jgi:hypothetical protein
LQERINIWKTCDFYKRILIYQKSANFIHGFVFPQIACGTLHSFLFLLTLRDLFFSRPQIIHYQISSASGRGEILDRKQFWTFFSENLSKILQN